MLPRSTDRTESYPQVESRTIVAASGCRLVRVGTVADAEHGDGRQQT
jgi:hypothetical protein